MAEHEEMRKVAAWPALFTAVWMLACSGQDGDHSGPVVFNSGIPGDKAVRDVSPEEAERYCQASFVFLQREVPDTETKRLHCTFVAFFEAAVQTVEECESVVADCIAEPGPSPAPPDCRIEDPRQTDCLATVDEVENCFNATVHAAKAVFRKVNCALVGASDAELLELQHETESEAQQCKSLRTKCPDLFPEAPTTGM